MPLIDLTGKKFGRLLVIGRASTSRTREATWLCVCDCGAQHNASGRNLRTSKVTSCGCAQRESRLTHGQCPRGRASRTYVSWRAMIERCRNPGAVNFKYYGGRGVSVCPRWQSFEAFAADMGERPPHHSLDRIDPNGNYEPANCRWASLEEQARNKRRAQGVSAC